MTDPDGVKRFVKVLGAWIDPYEVASIHEPRKSSMDDRPVTVTLRSGEKLHLQFAHPYDDFSTEPKSLDELVKKLAVDAWRSEATR